MLPRSLLHLLLVPGIWVCSAQQYQPQYYQQQIYQPQQQQFQQPSSFWQPQFDQQQPVQQFQQQLFTPQTQQQFFQPQQQQFQYQPQQFNPSPLVYQPQFQPRQVQFQPQQNFAPQQQFQNPQQAVYQPVNQSPRLVQGSVQQFLQPSPTVFQPHPQVFKEQPTFYDQTVKVAVRRPPPPPPVVQISSVSSVPQPQIIQIAAPPPPQKFTPYISDIFQAGSDTKQPIITVISPDANLPPGTYLAEEIIVDGSRPSFIENIEKFQPTVVNIPPKQVSQQRPAPVPQPQTKLKAPEIVSAPQQRPRPPPQAQPRPAIPALQLKSIPKKPAPVPSSEATTTNDIFLSCCQKRKVNPSCERICNFDILNKKTLTGMFLGTDPCPQSHGLDLLQCGASNDDHTQCCTENGVDQTSAGKKCLGFCNMKPGVSFQADVSMLPCWGVLGKIKMCFEEYIEDKLL